MTITPASPSVIATPSPAVLTTRATGQALLDRQSLFAGALTGTQNAARPEMDTPEARARAAAQEFVSVALVQPILKQMRQANQAPPPFGPGEGEKNFAHLADAQIARRIVESSNFGVVNAVEHQLLARLSPARTAAVLGDAPAQDEVATPPQEQP